MSVSVELLAQAKAINYAKRLLDELGFLWVDTGGGSSYWGKKGAMHRKIRVSDHVHTYRARMDVCANVEIEGPITGTDVEYRVRLAHDIFLGRACTRAA